MHLDVKRYLTQSFTKHGKFLFHGTDATLDVNRYLGQLMLLVWELCDVYNLMKIPQDPFRPTHFVPWTLSDFNIPSKVSLFQVLVFDFPLLLLFFLMFSLVYRIFGSELCSLFSSRLC